MLHRKITPHKVENEYLQASAYAQEQKVAAWLTELVPKMGLSCSLPTLVLSEEKKTKSFGKYPYDNIKLSLARLENKYAQGVLSADAYCRLQAQLQAKTKEVRIVEPLLACFEPPQKIVIYKPNLLARAKEHQLDLQQLLAEIMAHELFHAYHYNYLGAKQWSSNSIAQAKILTVKEALACFSQYSYLASHNLEQQLKLFQTKLSDSLLQAPSYPYAGARVFFDASWQPNSELFQDVLQQSRDDWQAAYKLIIHNEKNYISHSQIF